MKVLVTGSRDYENTDQIAQRLKLLPTAAILFTGGCPTGADFYAECWAATQHDIYFFSLPARWKAYGKAAGNERNSKLIELAPSIVLAFYWPGAANKGTKDCVAKAKARGITVEEFFE